MYHRAYKSVDEDQIGFQKYKIHDIKKQKEGGGSGRVRCEREGASEKERKERGCGKERKKSGETRARARH